MRNNNIKNTVWVYAMVLFISAFVVLLITAYSQIKYNKDLDNYKNQLYSQDNDKEDMLNNLGGTVEKNKKLKAEIDELKRELELQKQKYEEVERNSNKISDLASKQTLWYSGLIQAYILNKKGEKLKAANILRDHVNINEIGAISIEFYENLVKETYGPAAETLYKKGYEKYNIKEYNEAITLFKKSLEYTKGEYFSDDCMYLLGYSYYFNGNNKEAKETMIKFTEGFADSNYIKYAKELLSVLE